MLQVTPTPLDLSWLIDACGDDKQRIKEALLLLSAAATLSDMVKLPEDVSRVLGYEQTINALAAKGGFPQLPDDPFELKRRNLI